MPHGLFYRDFLPLFSMMPLFMANFGSTLDALGEPPEPGDEETVVEQVESFSIFFAVIGLVSGVASFTMVTLFTIAGERQVAACSPVIGGDIRLLFKISGSRETPSGP